MAGERFTVIIVNYNGGAMLLDCVRSALAEGVPAQQVIVVDNGSGDDSIPLLTSQVPQAVVIRNPCNAGFARAVNQGLRRVGTDFALLLNNDAQLQPGALAAFARVFAQRPRLALAGGQLLYADGRRQNSVAAIPTLTTEIVPKALLKLIQPRRYSGKLESDRPVAVESVIGACLAVRIAVLAEVGFLDEDFFFYMEETEWCLRARRRGYEVFYVPAARAVHTQGKTANTFRAQARIEFQRSKLKFFAKVGKPSTYHVVLMLLAAKALINVLANSALCLATLCLDKRQRLKTRGYWTVLMWYVARRPPSWGLPGKCASSEFKKITSRYE
ncbi:MAG: glycosyltransferase family 2 protein [Pseudomonadota bacterium]